VDSAVHHEAPTIKFVCLEPGAVFCFHGRSDIQTYDQVEHEWVAPPRGIWPASILMMLDSPRDAYDGRKYPTPEKMRIALTEELNLLFKRVFNSVNGGYLTIGYYHDPKSTSDIDDTVGYLYSASPVTLVKVFQAKDLPPPWFKLKAFW
jgi:hypothetical protein